MSASPSGSKPVSFSDLVLRLDAAVVAPNDGTRCRQVKEALEWAAERAGQLLTPEMVRPCSEHYARRLIHKDPAGRYSAVLMVWSPTQRTALHDHAGSWCVECVFQGTIRVDNYNRCANLCSEEKIFDFEHVGTIRAGVGNAGALIPPYEYHVIANEESETAVTLHVYGGEMMRCTMFEPVPTGGYRATEKCLSYTE
jgi:3-mercaptopropionate dioxygenase